MAMSSSSSLDAEPFEEPVRGLLDDPGPRVVVLVDPVAEAHQPERVVVILRPVHVLRDVAAVGGDRPEHLQDLLVGAAVERSPQGGDPGRDRGEQVGVARPDEPDRGRGAVLLVVGVEEEERPEGPGDDRVGDVRLGRDGEHHPQEVALEVERVVRIDERLADRLLVRPGRDRRHLRHQPDRADLDVLRVERVLGVLVERRQGGRRRGQDAHRVGVLREAVEEAPELLVEEGVAADRGRPGLELRRPSAARRR